MPKRWEVRDREARKKVARQTGQMIKGQSRGNIERGKGKILRFYA
jgi:hypothetical protein